MVHTLRIARGEAKALRSGTAENKVEKLLNKAMTTKRRNAGWSGKVTSVEGPLEADGFDGILYIANIKAACNPKRKRNADIIDREWAEILSDLSTDGWEMMEVDGEEYVAPEPPPEPEQANVGIPENYAEAFDGIFGREDQINMLLDAVQAGIDSGWHNRFNTVLWGEPAGGKTEIGRRLRCLLGDDAVLEFDGTAVTQAGLIKALKERWESGTLPVILFIEEIEKGNEDQWKPLLGLLDHRAEIRKDNAKENIFFKARMLCVATVNNKDRFDSFLAGALSSRFCNPIWVPRPSDKELRKILERDIKLLPNGKMTWIEPAIKFARDVLKTNDPREILRVCLCGKDDLLNGSYQKRCKACMPPS